MAVRIDHLNDFPEPASADASGLVAVGGDLGPQRLLAAYRNGIFPWTVNPISWWSPDPRGIFELNAFHVSRSLSRAVRKGIFQVTRDTAFASVMKACAEPGPGRTGDWITPEFITAYTLLHQLGHAHSVECWSGAELVGGIYGVSIGGLFAGESMFHKQTDASKVALYHLVEHLKTREFSLFDIQMVTAATRPLGAIELPRSEYLGRLAKAVSLDRTF